MPDAKCSMPSSRPASWAGLGALGSGLGHHLGVGHHGQGGAPSASLSDHAFQCCLPLHHRSPDLGK